MRPANPVTPHRARPLRAVIVGLLCGLVALALVEIFVFRPMSAENDGLRANRDQLRSDNARTETMIAEYDQFEREAARIQADFDAAIAAVPTEAELAGALDDLERVTEASGVDLVRFTPAVQARGGGAVPVLQSRRIALSVRCGFKQYRALLDRLATYPRLLTVETFSMRNSTEAGYTVEATVGMNCYYKPAPSAARPADTAKRL